MRKKFCPKCGKESERLYGNLCKECFLKEISFIHLIPKRFLIKKCKSCERYFFENKRTESLEEMVESILSKLLSKKEIRDVSYRIQNNKLYVSLHIKINDLEKTESIVSNLVIKKITCRECALKSLGYYQVIIQVRAPENLLDKIIKKIAKSVERKKSEKFAFISKMEKFPKGFNIYIGSKRLARKITKELKKEFNAKIKISRKLSGSIRGKRVYKDTILVLIGE